MGIGIPYGPIRRDGRPGNHGYVDLKRSPALIHQIPELQGNPQLFDFVQKVNGPDSAFRTLGCNGGRERAYVHIAFEVLHWNTSKNCYRRLVSDFVTWQEREGIPDSSVTTEFRICPASYWDHRFDGWAMSVHFDIAQQCGATIAERLSPLCEFLEHTSEILQSQLKGCTKTISSR